MTRPPHWSPPIVANATATTQPEHDPLIVQAAREVDRSLLDWALTLSPRERLRACTKAGVALARFKRGPSRAS